MYQVTTLMDSSKKEKFKELQYGRLIMSPQGNVFHGSKMTRDILFLNPYRFVSNIQKESDFYALLLNASTSPSLGSYYNATDCFNHVDGVTFELVYYLLYLCTISTVAYVHLSLENPTCNLHTAGDGST
jgi:hypothetical protein